MVTVVVGVYASVSQSMYGVDLSCLEKVERANKEVSHEDVTEEQNKD
jgi:hypothetical protein